MKTKARVYQQG
uniref:Uncharacterized protein n=1 Tax=Anguilla anguilla TaxID=7936 RepID=A0A0E9RDT2_ANGAN